MVILLSSQYTLDPNKIVHEYNGNRIKRHRRVHMRSCTQKMTPWIPNTKVFERNPYRQNKCFDNSTLSVSTHFVLSYNDSVERINTKSKLILAPLLNTGIYKPTKYYLATRI